MKVSQRSLVFIAGIILGVGTGWALGYWFSRTAAQPDSRDVAGGSGESDSGESDSGSEMSSPNESRIATLETEIERLEKEVDQQRGLLREESLSQTIQRADEMLGLFPARYPQGDWSVAEGMFEDCWFETADGLRLHGWLLTHDAPEYVILYAHGNAGNVTHRAKAAYELSVALNATVFIFDYRGYGRSEGVPTMEGLVSDAQAASRYLVRRAECAEDELVLLGRSLGGAIAVELAARQGARGLVLQSTFMSLREVARQHYPALLVNMLVADRLDSGERIVDYAGPVMISHGNADEVIPYAQGVGLFELANEPKAFFPVSRGDHNGLLPRDYYQELSRFLAETTR